MGKRTNNGFSITGAIGEYIVRCGESGLPLTDRLDGVPKLQVAGMQPLLVTNAESHSHLTGDIQGDREGNE